MAIPTLSPPVQESYNLSLLAVRTTYMPYKYGAMPMIMPRKGGTHLISRRYNPLKAAKVPLDKSGTTPPAQYLSAVDIKTEMKFYATWIPITEQVTLQSQDPVLSEGAIRLAVSMRLTEDELIRDMLTATAAVINCTNGTNGDNPTEITRADIDEVVRALEMNDAKTVMQLEEGDNKFGTAPVLDAYIAIANARIIGDLERVDGFQTKAQYPNQESVLRCERGNVSNVRFLTSSNASMSENASVLGADVINISVFGMEAYAIIDQEEYGPQFVYRDAMYSGPTAQYSTLAWKTAMATTITNDSWLFNLRCTIA